MKFNKIEAKRYDIPLKYSFKNANEYVESLNEYRQKRLMLSMIENIRIDLCARRAVNALMQKTGIGFVKIRLRL